MCLSRRVPLLLARGLVRLVVLDSLAAVFRCEFQAADWQERTRQMLSVSSTLQRLSRDFTCPVLCINQVIPALLDIKITRMSTLKRFVVFKWFHAHALSS